MKPNDKFKLILDDLLHFGRCPTYRKRNGAADTRGQDYEVALCCLLLLRAIRLAQDFFLASNHDDAGNFDDVVLIYRLPADELKYRVVLLQAKHKNNFTITLKALVGPKNDFSLGKYFESYLNVKHLWKTPVVMEQRLQMVEEVTLVLYTNARSDLRDAAVDVTNYPEMQHLTQILLTGGRMLRIQDAEQVLPPGEKEAFTFLHHFVLCTEQMSHLTIDVFLEAEMRLLLRPQSTDIAQILISTLKSLVKEWWNKKGTAQFLTNDSYLWGEIVVMEVDRLNSDTKNQSCELGLVYSETCLKEVNSMVKSSRKLCIVLAEGFYGYLERIKLYHALNLSLVVSLMTLEQNLEEIEILWGTSFCHTLVVDASQLLLNNDIILQLETAVDNNTERNLVVIENKKRIGSRWSVIETRKTWDDLDPSCQDRLLSTPITFQDKLVILRDLVVTETSNILSEENVARLSRGCTDIKLGSVIPSGIEYYVPRCIERKSIKDVFFINTLKDINVVIGVRGLSREEAKKIFDPKFSFMYFREILQKTQIDGATLLTNHILESDIRRLCSKFGCCGYFLDLENKSFNKSVPLWQAYVTRSIPFTWKVEKRIIVIHGLPGVGKSSFVTQMCYEAKERFPQAWVLRVNMGKEHDFIKGRDFSEVRDVKALLQRAVSENICDSLAAGLLDHALEITGEIFLFLDAFDEISPEYTAKCCKLLRCIVEKVRFRQLVVTTRSVTKKAVEKALGTHAYTLPVFSQGEQKEFLKRVCKSRTMDIDVKELHSLRTCAGSIMEIPLLCKMAAEVLLCRDDVVSTGCSNMWLYKMFIEQNIEVYLTDKIGLNSSVAGAGRLMDNYKTLLFGQLKSLAVTKLLTDDERRDIGIREEPLEHAVQMEDKLGLVTNYGGRVDFVHRTFTEFFLGLWLSDNWQKCGDGLLRRKLFQENFEVVTMSFNWFLFEDIPLYSAVAEGDVDTVLRFLTSESFRCTDRGGRTPLHVAAMTDGSDRNLWALLVSSGVNSLRTDSVFRWSVMKYAEQLGNWEMVEFLLEEGLSPDELERVKDEFTAQKIFPQTLRKGLQKFSLFILTLHKSFIRDVFCYWGETALHFAAASGSVPLVIELISLGAEVNAHDYSQHTAVSLAAYVGDLDMVTTLHRFGASLDKGGVESALREAVRGGRAEVVSFLLAAGADAHGLDIAGYTTLHWACSRNDSDDEGRASEAVVAYLLNHGVDPEVRNYDGASALHMVAKNGSPVCASLLLEHGVEVNSRDDEGATPLHWASRWGTPEIITLLLQYGAEVNAKDAENATPLQWASEDTASVLLEHGAMR